ncbi:MAG: hypothetical protein IJA51_00995 [Oscillospiraceae bacterium]|nr:hypothetical protein [Oscillospiraceae bacterium]
MSEHQVARHFTTILFPFRFAAEQLKTEMFNAPFVRKNGKETQRWQPDKVQPYHLKENVAAMLGVGEEKGSAGQIWRFNDSLRREMDIPEERTAMSFTYRGAKQPATVRLESIRLALFATGVGFLELSVRSEGSAEVIQDVNYFLSEVKSDDNCLSFEKKLSRDESVTVELTMLELVEKLLAPLGEVEDFDNRHGLHYVDNKPLVFTYLLMERFDEEFGKLLFGLRTNFKATYQVPVEEYDLDRSEGVLHPFENVYWGASLNAVACCAAMTDNAKTNEFFSNTFPANLRQTYLTLYILRQHQRYAIQDLQHRFAGVDRGLETENAEAVRRADDAVQQLLDDSIAFKLKCMFRNPSSVEHINLVDGFVARILDVRSDLKDLEDGVRQLEAVAGEIRGKIDAREARKKKMESLRKEGLICLLAAIWGCVAFFQESWEVVEKITGWSINFRSWLVVIPVVIAMFPLLKLVDEMRTRKKELREMEKEFGKNGEKK